MTRSLSLSALRDGAVSEQSRRHRGSNDAGGRGGGTWSSVGAAGRCGPRRLVGAGDAGAGAGQIRVIPAQAKGYDRRRGSKRGSQPAALPGLYREAGVPEGAHRHLVRDAHVEDE